MGKKIRRYLFVFFLITFFPTNIFAQDAVNKDEALAILQKDQILLTKEQNQLKQFVKQLDANGLDEKEFEELAAAISNKIKRDVKNLDTLSVYLRRLINNRFAGRLGRVSEGDIERIEKMMERLNEQIADVYKPSALDQDQPNAKEFVKIIRRDIISLIGGGRALATADVWKKIRITFRNAYNKWNAEFVALETSYISEENEEIYGTSGKKRKFYELPRPPQRFIKNAKPEGAQYDVEKLQFMRDFSKIQVIFRRLSESDSSEF